MFHRSKKEEPPMIQANAPFAQQVRRRTLVVFMMVLMLGAAGFLTQSVAVSMTNLEVSHGGTPSPIVRVATPKELPTEAPRREEEPAAENSGGRSDGADCPSATSRDGLLTSWKDGEGLSDDEPFAANETKRHFDSLMALLDERASCIRQQRKVLHEGSATTSFVKLGKQAARVFLDLGSRAIDSSTTFLKKFPSGADFSIHCFEANPAFNKHYAAFAKKRPEIKLTYHNQAVGVAPGTLVLSDRDVGSSIVRDNGGGAAVKGGTPVEVIDWPKFVAKTIGAEIAAAPPTAGSYVVVKMDIEKMEFAVLHRMIRHNLFAIVDDLLLECHYNTNKPRAQRNPDIHLGLDDCKALVGALNSKLNAAGAPTFTAVLWNSPKTAKGSRYSESHGGFFPT